MKRMLAAVLCLAVLTGCGAAGDVPEPQAPVRHTLGDVLQQLAPDGFSALPQDVQQLLEDAPLTEQALQEQTRRENDPAASPLPELAAYTTLADVLRSYDAAGFGQLPDTVQAQLGIQLAQDG